MKGAVLDLTAIVDVLNVDRDALAARLLGNENVLDLFDLERANTIRGDAAALLVEVTNSLASEGRRDLDGTVSELQCGISYRHGQDYIRICDGRNHFSTFFSLFFQVAGQDINSQIEQNA